MDFANPLQSGTLIKRYKRFLADVRLDNNDIITIHCPNTGAMTGCAQPDNRVWFSRSNNPKRKYAHTWELTQTEKYWIGINSAYANQIVASHMDQIKADLNMPKASVKAEYAVKVQNGESCRLDFKLEAPEQCCFIEVKSVTLLGDDGLGYFPDTVSKRAHKHLKTLIQLKSMGHRAAMIFCIQHTGIERFSPARHIDPTYTDLFVQAIDAGVECFAYRCLITSKKIAINKRITVQIN